MFYKLHCHYLTKVLILFIQPITSLWAKYYDLHTHLRYDFVSLFNLYEKENTRSYSLSIYRLKENAKDINILLYKVVI